KVKALGANGVMSGSRVRVVWMKVDGRVVRSMVVSSVVVKVVLIGWEVFERWFSMEPSEKHSVGKSHIGTLDHTHHSVGDVVGEVEEFFNGEAIEHVA
nr:hypothetical protein [Tanacetum cinerariifolium]